MCFNHYSPDGAITDGLFVVIIPTALVVTLLGKTGPDPVNHLRNFQHWNSIKGHQLNDEVMNPVLNPTIRTFQPLGFGTFVTLPNSLDCSLDFMGASFFGSIAPHLEHVNILTEGRDSVVQLRAACITLLEFFILGVQCSL